MINFSNKTPSYFPYVSVLVSLLLLFFLVLNELTEYRPQIMRLYAIQTEGYWALIQNQPTEIFRTVTSLFLHGNWVHWLVNYSIFVLLAFSIEKVISGHKFLLVFLLAGIIGNLVASFFLQNQDNVLIGASGAVSGLIGYWLVLFPRKKINFILPIGLYLQKTSMPIAVVIFLWLVVQIILQFQPHPSYDIAWISHIMGFASGFCLAWFIK